MKLTRANASLVAVTGVLLALAAREAGSPPTPVGAFTILEAGLEIGAFGAAGSEPGIRILRIDPERFRLRLLNASATKDGRPQTAAEWCRANGLVAAINAGMYQEDRRTSVSLMKTRGHTNNPRLSKDMTVLAFDPRENGLPEVRIIDRECEDYETLAPRYGTLVQSIRMLSCKGRNVWTPQPKRSSIAALGIDAAGRVLLIHSRTPRITHDFIEDLRVLPIGLNRAMYLEGGAEAQMFVRSEDREFEFGGSYNPALEPEGTPARAWRIPNVIGIARRAGESAAGR